MNAHAQDGMITLQRHARCSLGNNERRRRVGIIDNSASCWIKYQHESRAANQRTSRAGCPDVCRNRYLSSRPPVRGSIHKFKYRLALVADSVCVLRYDNEAGKGDHRHIGSAETRYKFVDSETLLADFWNDVEAWRR